MVSQLEDAALHAKSAPSGPSTDGQDASAAVRFADIRCKRKISQWSNSQSADLTDIHISYFADAAFFRACGGYFVATQRMSPKQSFAGMTFSEPESAVVKAVV